MTERSTKTSLFLLTYLFTVTGILTIIGRVFTHLFRDTYTYLYRDFSLPLLFLGVLLLAFGVGSIYAATRE